MVEKAVSKLLKDRYSICTFITEKNSPSFVVPNTWLYEDEGSQHCWWNTKLRGKRLTEAVKNAIGRDPAEKTWVSKLVTIKYRNGTQTKCDQKLDSYISNKETSGIDTDVGMDDKDDDSGSESDEHVDLNKLISSKAKVNGSRNSKNDTSGSDEPSRKKPRTENVVTSDDKEGSNSDPDSDDEGKDKAGPSNSGKENTEQKKNSSSKTFRRRVLTELQQLKVLVTESLAKSDQILGMHGMNSGKDIVPRTALPLVSPDHVLALDKELSKAPEVLKKLEQYLTVKGSSPASAWECASGVLSALFTDECGYYFNYKGQRCEGEAIIARDSHKIGLEKGMPCLFKLIEGVFNNICAAEKNRLKPAEVSSRAGRWLVKRGSKLKKCPSLPWKWGNSEDNTEGNAEDHSDDN